MAKPQQDLHAQNIFRHEILKEVRLDPGTETTLVYAETECGSPALFHARDLRLKSIQHLQLTVDAPDDRGQGHDLFASKTIYNKGRKGNYASVYVFDLSTAIEATGSHYLNITAMGE